MALNVLHAQEINKIDYTRYVDTFIGTQGGGNIFPGAFYPFGMVKVGPDCKDYPCKRFDSEKNGYDSFVTHKMIFTNLDFIKSNGIGSFIELQKIRM